jgi:hypothetical protein
MSLGAKIIEPAFRRELAAAPTESTPTSFPRSGSKEEREHLADIVS